MAEIRIRINPNVKLHECLLAEFNKYTVHERNEMIIDALAEYFLYRDTAPTTRHMEAGRDSSDDELICLIKELGTRLASVETALSGQQNIQTVNPVSNTAEAGADDKTAPGIQDGSGADTEPERPPAREEQYSPEMRTEFPDSGDYIPVQYTEDEPEIPPAVLNMMESLQNG